MVAQTEGKHTYTSEQVCDAAGNCATGSVTIKLDKTAPTVTGSVGVQPSSYGWYGEPLTVTWDAQDNLSQVIAPATTPAALEGEHVYTSNEICDAAGNCSTGSRLLKIDTSIPVINALTFSKNPKSISDVSTMLATSSDTVSNIVRAQYFIGDTGNVGQDADMVFADGTATTDFGTDFGTGVYDISVRVMDAAGHWSEPYSDYLVVYDTRSGVRVRGSGKIRTVTPASQLPWMWLSSGTRTKYALSVRYGADGKITRQSDFQFSYRTAESCRKKAHGRECHRLELNATKINWLTTYGQNNAVARFKGDGVLKLDGAASDITFVVEVVDGERKSPLGQDLMTMTVYQDGAIQYFVAPTETGRGNIRISF
jgi:uncharacterized Fe-S cluster protein YjdI